ncbi:MAG: ankyrin repeat domain-containing protein [Candidatus Angelobacter sp.]
MVASNGGHVEIVRILLESGANVKARDDQGKTAMAHAKELGRGNRDRDAVIALLEAAAAKK